MNLNVKVKANVQIELTGESPAVKDGGVLISLINEIEVEALPNDLPEKFVLNISSLLKIGDEFKVSDLNYDASKVTLAVGVDVVLVEINEPKVEIEPEVVAPVVVETTVQGAKKEGWEGAEDVAADAKDAKAGAPKASPTKAPTATTKPAEKKEEKWFFLHWKFSSNYFFSNIGSLRSFGSIFFHVSNVDSLFFPANYDGSVLTPQSLATCWLELQDAWPNARNNSKRSCGYTLLETFFFLLSKR